MGSQSSVYKKPSSLAKAIRAKSPDIGRIVGAFRGLTSVIRQEQAKDIKDDEESDTDTEWRHYGYDVENLVFSGGGIKGYSYIGALKALEDSGILTKVKRVAGSSVGAICAGLLAIGCSPQEIANVFSVDVKWLFHDEKFEKLFCLPNVLRGYGIHKAERFYRILGRHFELKVSDPDITFGQLYKKLGRELCIVVTNLTKMRSEYCHHTTTPDMPIRKAVRMSMAFPVVYKPVQHETNGALSWYTDGGMLDQYPVHCFDDLAVDLNQNQNDRKSPRNWKTVGLYVVSESPLDYEIWRRLFGQEIPFRPGYVPDTKLARSRMKKDHPKKRKTHSERSSKKHKHNINGSIKSYDSRESIYEWPESRREISIKSFGEFMITTIEALLLHQRKLTIQPADIDRTIPINCGYIATNDYHLEAGDREFMLRQGYECTRQFLIRHAQNAQKSREKEEIAQHEEQQPTETSSESENQTEMKRSSTSARFVLVNQNSIETEV